MDRGGSLKELGCCVCKSFGNTSSVKTVFPATTFSSSYCVSSQFGWIHEGFCLNKVHMLYSVFPYVKKSPVKLKKSPVKIPCKKLQNFYRGFLPGIPGKKKSPVKIPGKKKSPVKKNMFHEGC